MKKPLHTRYVQKPFNGNYKKNTFYEVNHRLFGNHGYLELGFLVSRLSASLEMAKRNRDFVLKRFSKEKGNSKYPFNNYCQDWLAYKRRVNKIIKRHTKLLKSAEKALKRKTEILDITTLSSI